MHEGTINIQLAAHVYDLLPFPNQRVQGRDPIDFEHNQDFLIRKCKLKGTDGYQILPINKTTGEPRGHHELKRIEIALRWKIELTPGEELRLELQDVDD
jgi:hypothetical protein